MTDMSMQPSAPWLRPRDGGGDPGPAPAAHGPTESFSGGQAPDWTFASDLGVRASLGLVTPPVAVATSEPEGDPSDGAWDGSGGDSEDAEPQHDNPAGGGTPAWASRAGPMLGPSGKSRRPAAVIALSILTGGLYTLFWHHRVNREMRDFDARMHVRPGRSTFAVALPFVATIAVALGAAAILYGSRFGIHVPGAVPHWVAFAALFAPLAAGDLCLLLPLSALATTMTLERIRVVQDRVGMYPDTQLRPARNACWLLLPAVGGLVLVAREQAFLNRAWDSVVPPLEARAGA